MERRELLKKGALLAGASFIPRLVEAAAPLPNCVYSMVGKEANCDPTQTCQYYGMVGRYPNCYYPQYGLLNANLANATLAVRNQVTRAVQTRTISPNLWATLKSYNAALTYHLSVAQTTINEKLRLQTVGSMAYEPATAPLITQGEQWAYSNGFDPNLIAGSIESSMPMASKTTDPTLQEQILQLPNTQALDHLSEWTDQVTSSVMFPGNGICQYWNPPQLQQTGSNWMNIGAGTGVLSLVLPAPVDALVGAASAAAIGYGFVLWVAGTMCME